MENLVYEKFKTLLRVPTLRTASSSQPMSYPVTVRMLLGASLLLSSTTTGRLWGDDALPVAEVQRDEPVDFEADILPLLRRNCIACHNASDAESDLVLETPESILKGGAEGPGVVPGSAEESLVFQLAAHQRESFMPPEENTVGASDFTPEELGLIKLWIDQGAKGEVTGDPEGIKWQPLPPGFNPIYTVAVSPYGRAVAAGRANQIFIYSVPSQRELGRLTDPELLEAGLYQRPGVAHRDLVHSLAFSPSGQWLASGGFGTVKLWRRETGVRQGELPAAAADIRALSVSGDGQRAAVVQEDGQVQVYDVAGRQLLCTIAEPAAGITSIAFSPDGTQIIGGALDRIVRLWDAADGRQVGAFESPVAITAVAISGDGKQILIGGSDFRIRIWETAAANVPAAQQGQPPQPLKELQGHTADVVAITALTSHPTQFVSASLDGTAKHWDAAGGSEIRSFNHGAPLRCLAVRADGGRIVTGAETGTVKLWNAQDGQQIVELTNDRDAQNEIDDLQLAIELARLQARSAQTDLDAAVKRKQEEIDHADKAAVELVRSQLEAKQKQEAAAVAIAAKEAAEKELARLQAELAAAETGKQNATDETRAQADQVLSEVTQKLKEAEQQLAKLGPPAQKATDEKATADGAVESAERAVERSKEAVLLAAAEVPRFQQLLEQRKQEQRAVEDRLAQMQQSSASRNALARELESRKVAADQAARATLDQLRSARATRDAALGAMADARAAVLAKLAEGAALDAATQDMLVQARQHLLAAEEALGGAGGVAGAAQARLAQLERELTGAESTAAAEDEPTKAVRVALVEYLSAEQVEAVKVAAEAEARLQAATAERAAAAEAFAQATQTRDAAAGAARKAAEDAQQLVKAATVAKTAADQAATEADARHKATEAAKVAADGSLTAAKEKLTQAGDEAAKAIAEVEVQIAMRRQEAAAEEVAEASMALQAAGEAKTAAERALAAATAESQQMQEAANQTRSEAQRVYQETQNALAQADAAAGGAEARAATAAQIQAAADAALAQVRTPVRGVAFSSDGTHLAVVDAHGQGRFYSSETGAPLYPMQVSDSTVAAAAPLAGDRLLIASEDRSLELRNGLPMWTLQRRLGGEESTGELAGRVTALDFSPNGELLATGGGEASRSGELKLWDVESGQLVRAIPEPHSDAVLGVAFSPDGKYLASCGADRLMRVFEVETGQLVNSFEGHTHHVLGVSWRADGRLLATSGADNVIKVWDFATGEQIRTIEGFNKEITAIEFLGASDNFVVSTGSQQVATRNVGGGGGPNFGGATDFVYDVEASRNGRLVVAAGQDSVVRIWDQQGNSIVTFAPPPAGDTPPSGDAQPAPSEQAATR